MPGELGFQTHTLPSLAHFHSEATDVTIPKLHKGVIKCFVRDMDCFSQSSPNGCIPFSPIKRGVMKKNKLKINTLLKLNFSLCKHYLFPHPFVWSLSTRPEMSNHRFWPWWQHTQCLYWSHNTEKQESQHLLTITNPSKRNFQRSLILTFFF